MKRFDSESVKKEFKDLCADVLPAIGNIEQALEMDGVTEGATVRVGDKGYMSFDIHGSKWRMARYEKGGPVKIIYEHSEEISISQERIFDKVSENLVEISLMFASLQPEIKGTQEIDSLTWKQMFMQWANEFETAHKCADWDQRFYLEEIGRFARNKIMKFAGVALRDNKVVGYKITDIGKNTSVTVYDTQEVFNRIVYGIDVREESAADCVDWCESAGIGEVYDEVKFAVKIVEGEPARIKRRD